MVNGAGNDFIRLKATTSPGVHILNVKLQTTIPVDASTMPDKFYMQTFSPS